MSHDAEPYVGYLEKEMTILGVLSAFCMGSLGLLIGKVVFATDGRLLHYWQNSKCPIVDGCALIFIAAFLFYTQRADLAYLYGQICLGIYRKDKTVQSRIDEADTWENWTSYQRGFACLSCAGLEMILAAIQIRVNWSNWTVALISIAIVLLASFICWALKHILLLGDATGTDDPYMDFFKGLIKF